MVSSSHLYGEGGPPSLDTLPRLAHARKGTLQHCFSLESQETGGEPAPLGLFSGLGFLSGYGYHSDSNPLTIQASNSPARSLAAVGLCQLGPRSKGLLLLRDPQSIFVKHLLL